LYQAADEELAWTVRLAVGEALPYVAVMVTTVVDVTPLVLIVNVALELPAGMVTEAGTDAMLLLLPSVITAPPVGALPARVTVPWEEDPPVSDAGFSVTPVNAGVTVTVVVCAPPL
jgi:hypothetical protein